MNRPIFFSSFLGIQTSGSKLAHFGGDAAVESGGVEMGDGADAALAGQKLLPNQLGADSQRADQTDTRYHDPAAQTYDSP